MSPHTFIGLDWGTSSLRAYLFSRDGAVLEQREAAVVHHPADGDGRSTTHFRVRGSNEPRERRLVKLPCVLKLEQLRDRQHLGVSEWRPLGRLPLLHKKGAATDSQECRQDQRRSNHQNLG